MPLRLAERLQQSWWKPRPDALARALVPLSWVYERLAQRKVPAVHVGVPVVVVGNFIVGGAGKTPTVIALVELLRAAGFRPGVLSRGHGRAAEQVHAVTTGSSVRDAGDEPLLIHLRTRAPVFVGRHRVAAAQALRANHPEVDVLVCDDGLQHRALARDVEVVVFDERGTGNGLLLPAGPLRERVPASLPARSLVLYNAAAPTTPLPGWTARRELAGVLPLADWWLGRGPQAVQALQGRRVVAAAGIADPARFFRMLEHAGISIEPLPLPDHHDYAALPWPADAEVVVTEKDAVKLRPDRPGAARVWVAALDFRPDPAFNAALLRALPHR